MEQSQNIGFNKPIKRDDLVALIDIALSVKEYRFARQTSLAWLSTYPGDLHVKYQLAQALVGSGKAPQAVSILEELAAKNPENTAVWEALSSTRLNQTDEQRQFAHACLAALGENVSSRIEIPEWAASLKSARTAVSVNNLEEAEALTHKALQSSPSTPLPAILHTWIASLQNDLKGFENQATIYHTHWPDCLQFSLFLADARIKNGDEAGSVALLHQCAAQDAVGVVAKKIWGDDFSYKTLWPENLEAYLELMVPATVAFELGWNKLPEYGSEIPEAQTTASEDTLAESAGGEGSETASDAQATDSVDADIAGDTTVEETASAETTPVETGGQDASQETTGQDTVESAQTTALNAEETSPSAEDAPAAEKSKRKKRAVKESPKAFPNFRIPTDFNFSDALRAIQQELQRIAQNLLHAEVGTADGRFPMYVIFTTKAGLNKQFGSSTATVIQNELQKLADTIQKRPNWGSLVYYADDPVCTAKYGLKPVSATDPWKLKLALTDLDNALIKQGEMIGVVLIVGGPEVVPFHRLPNPTDDSDDEIASDNPYASKDENYFVPEWPVGRLPGGNTSDSGVLLSSIRKIASYHAVNTEPSPWWRKTPVISQTAKFIKKTFNKSATTYNFKPAFGYTAAVWKQSSVAVYKPIGEQQSMLVSPPTKTGSIANSGLMPAWLTYFNLHGLPDAPEWYGQKDGSSPASDPDYPVALSIKDIDTNGQAPRLVFSEACYGAFIDNLDETKSLALKFLSCGTLAMVGSTCIAYGSVTTPLIGADLLGYNFWKQVQSGQTVGEAYLQAKINLVQEMSQRQGYLDGEDQKTLISFVLYGDPLVTLNETAAKQKAYIRARVCPTVLAINDHTGDEETVDDVSTDLVAKTKKIVQQYLPSYQDAEIQYCQYNPDSLVNVGIASGAQISSKVKKTLSGRQTKIVLNKSIDIARRHHQQYARITVDERGKVTKLVVSR